MEHLCSKVGLPSAIVKSLKIQTDGKILLAGTLLDFNDFQARRFNADGTRDLTFGMTEGAVNVDFSGNNDIANSIAIAADGKIYLGGTSDNGTDTDAAFVRLNADGTLDTTFDADGKVTHDLFGDDDKINDIAIDGNGKLVGTGSSVVFGVERLTVVRLNT